MVRIDILDYIKRDKETLKKDLATFLSISPKSSFDNLFYKHYPHFFRVLFKVINNITVDVNL